MSFNDDLIISGLSDLSYTIEEIDKKKRKLTNVINEINSINTYREKIQSDISRLECLKSSLLSDSSNNFNIDVVIMMIDLRIYEWKDKIVFLKPKSLLKTKYTLKKDIELMEDRNRTIEGIVSLIENGSKSK